MTFRILRYEKTKDKNNNDEVFISVEINDGTAIYNRAEWLTSFETQQLLANESLLNQFSQQIAERGQIAYNQQNQTPPQVDLN
jgi:hypothetical protein